MILFFSCLTLCLKSEFEMFCKLGRSTHLISNGKTWCCFYCLFLWFYSICCANAYFVAPNVPLKYTVAEMRILSFLSMRGRKKYKFQLLFALPANYIFDETLQFHLSLKENFGLQTQKKERRILDWTNISLYQLTWLNLSHWFQV